MRRLLFLLLAMAGSACAAFVPPSEGPVPFRRDKLPVDVDTMTKLSRQLVVLAGQMDPDQPANARTVAQLLALSQALDPSNNQVRDLVDQLKDGGEVPRGEEREVDLAQARAWDLLGWLEQPEAGEDGQALGACLSDVLVKVDPQHPVALKRGDAGERGAWKDWVAGLNRFGKEKEPDVVETDTGNEPDMSGGDEGEDKEPEQQVAKILLSEVTCSMPVRYYMTEEKKSFTRPVEFTLKTWAKSDGKKMVVELPGEDWNSASKRSNEALFEFLEARHGSLPDGLSMSLNLPKGVAMNISRNAGALRGLLVVMANAAFTGVPPDGMVFAAIDDDKSLAGPNRFWETIRALSDAGEDDKSGGRLVIPNAMREYLPPLLTLGKSDFFFRYEVLLADDVDDLLSLSSSQPSEELLTALNGFKMIRDAKGTRSLGSFVSHSSTQQRLGQIVSGFPQHASARMLALRGTSSWPKRLDRKIYAMELRSALRPMGKVLEDRWDSMSNSALSKAEGECREMLEDVEKLYGSVSDRSELHDPAYSAAKSLSSLAADLKRMDESDRGKIPSRVRATYLDYVETMALLTAAAGDKDEYPLPDRERSR
ncbi:hypothetical protein [Haloferula rosea]|uniref:Uncharacterized protein n=1 Tax=Haloferula rosea TaxID=490093 RepID=A0A934VFK7_9BACT|nr:hypothetical protein [Haloferula rosea]MBK1826685.1 hypothetical protein [Haloferula rosea]